MIVPLERELLLIRRGNPFLLVAKAAELFVLCIETFEKEICQTVGEGDLIVVSAPEGGDLRHAAILIELVRTYHQPVFVLPKAHPGSARLSMVVSAGPEVIPRCDITRGTHPEQDLICAPEEFGNLRLSSAPGGVEVFVPEGEADLFSISKL
ncbi:MAG: hypothetical protein JW931_07510 [Methanomicrobiaceae archaeon]|nr:hypothetical protein [Methanomicrobiaceae archaeon]